MAGVSNGNAEKFPGIPFEVAERRPETAHGETVGINAQTIKAPDGAKEISVGDFLPRLRHWGIIPADSQAAEAWRSGVSADRRIFGLFKRRRSTETPLRF